MSVKDKVEPGFSLTLWQIWQCQGGRGLPWDRSVGSLLGFKTGYDELIEWEKVGGMMAGVKDSYSEPSQ